MLRKSKGWLILNTGICLGLALLCGQVPGTDIFSQAFLWLALIFGVWAAWKFYRDYRLSQGRHLIRETHAYYQRPPEPPELMSRGSQGLPTHFDRYE